MGSFNFNTRSRNKLWLLDDYVPLKNADSDRFVFCGASPPSVQDVFMNFKGQHAKLQDETKRQSKVRNAAEKTVFEVRDWWKRTGIELKSEKGLLKMILTLHERYQALQKNKKSSSKQQVEARNKFLQDCKQIFWAVSSKYEQKASTSTNPVLIEDFQWLQALKDSTKHVVIGAKDMKTAQKLKRKINEENSLARKTRKEHSIEFTIPLETDSESEVETSQDDENFEPPCAHQNHPKRVSLLNPEVCKVADKHQISHRALTEIVFADKVTHEISSDQVTLSVMTCKRQRDAERSVAGSKLQHNIEQSIEAPESLFVLQWDGKMLEGLHHVDKGVEHVAVILHSLTNPEKDILLSMIGLHNMASTAENEALLIRNELQKYPEVKNKIVGFCFDTTAVNTGVRNGVIVKLQDYLEKKLLLLACRHHIFELCCGAVCRSVFGDTESPFEKVFDILRMNWDKININQFDLFDTSKLPRNLQRRCEEVLQFCQAFLQDQHLCLVRKDYKEFICLGVIYLGGSLNSSISFSINAPGAISHARWMSKVIYTLKLALFSSSLLTQDLLDEHTLEQIRHLALFLVLYHLKAWFTSTDPTLAPFADLTLYQMLKDDLVMLEKIYSKKDVTAQLIPMLQVYLQKLDCHLWYLSERLVVLALFSDVVSDNEKSLMAKTLIKCKKNSSKKISLQQMPALSNMVTLTNLIGPDSWTIFNLLNIECSFLKMDPSGWSRNTSYKKAQMLVQSLNVVNDAAERSLGLLTAFNTGTVTLDPTQRQILFKMVSDLRHGQLEIATSSERVTKKGLFKLKN